MRSLLLVAGAAASRGSPIQEVLNLLVKLEAKCTDEGKAEAVAYDKFACFCKEQASDKTYAIERDEKKIKKLSARIEQLSNEIDVHNKKISDLDQLVTDKKKESEDAIKQRADERAVYEKKDNQFSAAIKACEQAREALMQSGGSAGSFLQMALAEADMAGLEGESLDKLKSYAAQAPAAYNYHSSEIISTLEGLIATIKGRKKQNFAEEHSAKSTHDSQEVDRQNEIKFAEEELAQHRADTAAKSSEKETKEGVRADTKANKEADEAFRSDLAGQCERKATQFDQRTASRRDEIAALQEAIGLMEGDGGQMWSANKKLAQAESFSQVSTTDSEDNVDEMIPSDTAVPSFIQSHSASRDIQRTRIMELLTKRSKMLKSPVLAALTVRLQKAGKDHFFKVRQLIDDLIKRLEDQEDAEATKQAQCAKDMKAAMEGRDDTQSSIERLNGLISELESYIAEGEQKIKDLQTEIAGLKKALKEMTELRDEERADNEATIKDAEAGEAAVKSAIETLEEYYNKSFLQRGPEDTHAGDREGNTVQDLAPETFENEDYVGAQEGAKGILGLLANIKRDYTNTITDTNDAEAAAQSAFETSEKANLDNQEEKQGSLTDTEELLAADQQDLAETEDELERTTKENGQFEEELTLLKASCVDTEVSYEERVARRKQEIASLKEALAILEEMGNSAFLQKRM